MVCPVCNSEKLTASRTKKDFEKNNIKRHRMCKKCGFGWSTTETPDPLYFKIKENSGFFVL